MKKAFFSLFIAGLLLGGIFQHAQALDKKLAFNFNIGFQASSTFETGYSRFILGGGLDFHPDKLIAISPEFQLWIFDFGMFSLTPGAILNLTFNNFFVGGGLILSYSFYEGEFDEVHVMPKINLGYRSDILKLTLCMIPPYNNFPDEIMLGASIGIVF